MIFVKRDSIKGRAATIVSAQRLVNADGISDWPDKMVKKYDLKVEVHNGEIHLSAATPDGFEDVRVGDWIVTEPNGNHWVIPPEIFYGLYVVKEF